MNMQHTLAVAVLALMSGTAAMAQTSNGNSPLTRAEVRQSVIAARDAGQLLPAGDSAQYPLPSNVAPSTLTRSVVQAQVLEARASGDLIPAGESDDAFFARTASTTNSGLTRADVKQATLQARDAGDLIPAGEGDASEIARDRAQERYARAAYLARKASASASVVASSN